MTKAEAKAWVRDNLPIGIKGRKRVRFPYKSVNDFEQIVENLGNSLYELLNK